MSYSVNSLNTVGDCDVLLSWAAREKSDLNYKKISDERMTSRYAETSIQLDADLQIVIAEIGATETIISLLPDGPTKDDAIDKKTRLEYKKFLLESRIENYGTVALLEKEVDLARVIQELNEIESFIGVVTTRRLALAA